MSKSKDKDCGCLDKIQKALTENHKSEVTLHGLKMWMDWNSGVARMGLPPLEYSYMDGKKKKKSYVKFSMCPFCGVKLT